MGLAASQSRYLFLDNRRSDVQLNISLLSMRKMQLTREQSALSAEFNSKLAAKDVAFYDNGEYNQITYGYLMGYGSSIAAIINKSKPLKENLSMMLTDYKGNVILSDTYANAIMSVMGTSIMDGYGRGKTFSEDKIPEILSKLFPGYSADQFRNGIESHPYTSHSVNALTGEIVETEINCDNAEGINERLQSITDFFYPIFLAASANGWTTEYNQSMAENSSYISDAISSGTFQLTSINDAGHYDESIGLDYFIVSGDLELRSDADKRAELTNWKDAESNRIKEAEEWLDIQISDLSTELEAINTEIQSVKSFISKACQSVFNWGNS